MNAQVSVEIAAPLAAVWAITQSPELRHRWDARVATYETDGHPPRTFQLTARMGPFRPQAFGRIVLWREGRQSAIVVDRTTSRLVPCGAGSWTFDATANGTTLTSRFSFPEADIPRLIPARLFLAVFRWDTLQSFRRLKRLIESGAISVSNMPSK